METSQHNCLDQVEARFEQYLDAHSLPYTFRRRQLLRLAFTRVECFTAEGLWQRAMDVDQSTSRSTVYRTLGLLRDCGLVQEIKVAKGERLYFPRAAAHDDPSFLICSDCGKVIEFQDDHMAMLENCITRRLGFKPSRKFMRIEATCEELRAHGSCKRAALAKPSN